MKSICVELRERREELREWEAGSVLTIEKEELIICFQYQNRFVQHGKVERQTLSGETGFVNSCGSYLTRLGTNPGGLRACSLLPRVEKTSVSAHDG